MRSRTATRALSAAAAFAMATAACASPGYDAGKLRRELVKAGATPQQAQCVTDGLENGFDLNQLGSHTDPNNVEVIKARAVIVKCGIKLPPR